MNAPAGMADQLMCDFTHLCIRADIWAEAEKAALLAITTRYAIARPGAVSRRIKCLTVADDFSHECVDITADFGIGGAYVTRLLDRAATFRVYPKAVRTDNGPEFTCRAFMTWTQKHGIKHIEVAPNHRTV